MADEENDQQDEITFTLYTRLRITRAGALYLDYIAKEGVASQHRIHMDQVFDHADTKIGLPGEVSPEQIRYLKSKRYAFAVTGRVMPGDTLFMMSEDQARAEGVTEAERRASFERFQQKTERVSRPVYADKLDEVIRIFSKGSRGGARHGKKESPRSYHDLDDTQMVEFALRVEEIASADKGDFRKRRQRALDQAAKEFDLPAEYGGKDRMRALRRLAEKGRTLIAESIVRGHSKRV